jgi:zinc transport system substrate-binding protein
MRKVLWVFISILTAISACSKKPSGYSPDSIKITASFYPVFIIALNVVKDVKGITLNNLTPPITGCLHDYSITANEMKTLEKSDLLLVNGGGMESFIEKVAKTYPKIALGDLSEGIDLIKSGGEPNPHIWVSVSNAIQMTKNCVKAVSAIDSKHKEEYERNGQSYIRKLENLKSEMNASMKQFSGKKIVTFHEAFPYFAREYNLIISAVVEREPGSEPSARELADTILTVRKSGIKAIFAEPQYPVSAANTIAKETSAKVYTLDPAVTGADDPDAYIAIMKKNLVVLKEALR